jgi:hypothetical protein
VSVERLTDVRPFVRFAVRDALITGVTLALLAWDRALLASGAADAQAAAVGVAAGVTFALSSFFAHEWGHWLGAVLTGGLVHPPRTLASFFLFFFDTGRSTRRQFLAMSYGGYGATLLALAALVAWARVDAWSGRTALVLAGLGMTITAALEVPTTWKVARGAPLPTGFAFVGPAPDGSAHDFVEDGDEGPPPVERPSFDARDDARR